jgi:DNA-binding GntR family transcriptional regulator
MEIDRASPVPPYQQIAAFLRAAILRGDFAPGSRLPGVEQTVQEWGVARTTARKALALIRDEGYTFASVGLGYYVRNRAEWPAGDS